MTIYSIIQKSQLEGAHPIDAEYYQIEARQSYESCRKSKELLGDAKRKVEEMIESGVT